MLCPYAGSKTDLTDSHVIRYILLKLHGVYRAINLDLFYVALNFLLYCMYIVYILMCLYILIGLLRYQVDFQHIAGGDLEFDEDFDLDDY